MSERLLTPKEAAEMCRVHPRTVKKWVQAAGWNMERLGNGRYTILFPESLIRQILRRHVPEIARQYAK